LREIGDAPLEELAHIGIEGAHGKADRSLVRDHVHRLAALDRADGHDGDFRRIDVARHDRL
jgi:hypothetical protein